MATWTKEFILFAKAFPPIKINTSLRRDIGLWARRRETVIRDWRPNSKNDEPQQIYDLLLRHSAEQRNTATGAFDPEGPLEVDLLDRDVMQESYGDGDGCFLLAVAVAGDDEDGEGRAEIVGTLGMIAGRKVVSRSSGASVAAPELRTAALRRVCVAPPDRGDDDTVEQALATRISVSATLEDLMRQGELRAAEAGATALIGLAFPETWGGVVRPSAELFAALGYQASDQQIPGVAVVQFEKDLSKIVASDGAAADNTATGRRAAVPWVVPAILAAVLSLGLGVVALYSNVFGIEQLWGSPDNGGVGTSLSTQNLQELLKDERLGRTGLDDVGGGAGAASARQWTDLSPEELREEQALMKIIQGQSLRSK